MKFEVKASAFLEAISPVVDISQKAQKDFAGLYKINLAVEQAGITLEAFNGKMAIRGSLDNITVEELDFNYSESGTVCIDSRYLINSLKSFKDDQKLVVELVEKDASKMLYMKCADDEEQYQTITCHDKKIDLPEKATKFRKEISINRTAFISAVKNIEFAFGTESNNLKFLHWCLKVSPNNLHFSASSGGVLACLDIDGPAYTATTPKSFDMLFFNAYMPIILNVLGMVGDDTVKIQESDPHGIYQTVFSTTKYELTVVGLNPDVTWIDETVLTSNKTEFKAVVDVVDLFFAMKGTMATFTDEMKKDKKSHVASLDLSVQKKTLEIKTDNKLKSVRKVKLVDVLSMNNMQGVVSHTYARYLADIPTCWEGEGTIQIEFMADGNAAKKPIFVFFNAADKVCNDTLQLKSVNAATGLNERFMVAMVQINP